MEYRKLWKTGMMMIILCALFISGCTIGKKQDTADELQQPVTLVGYLIGTAPAGLKDVLTALNAKLQKDLNINLDVRYIAWSELATRYPLLLTSDESPDFIFSSNWTFYSQLAAQGAFREIHLDAIKTFMPLHYQATNPLAWKQAEVGSKLYMIPSATPDLKVPVTLIRGDLREKYGIPPISRFKDLQPYLQAIKANEPGMVPLRLDKQYDFSKAFSNLQWELGPALIDAITTTNGFSGVFTSWDSDNGALVSIFDEPQKSSYLQAAATVKEWYDRGYINHDVIANKVRSKDSFEQGLSAVAFGNSNDIQSTLAKAEQKGWKVEIIPSLSNERTYISDPFVNNGVALPADSKHPELTMRMLDLIMENPEYSRLVYFGIEGKNYIIKNGEVTSPEGISPEMNDYPPDAAGFWFTNKSEYPPYAAWSSVYRNHREQIENMLVPYHYASFNFNAVPVKSELEQINQAAIQYLNPLLCGMVTDVNQAFKQLQIAVNEAGFPKVMSEAKRQARDYLQQIKAEGGGN